MQLLKDYLFLKPANISKKELLIEIAAFLITVLFLYAAFSKLTVYETFKDQLAQSPMLPQKFIPFIALLVPLSEIVIAWMLVFEKTKAIGFQLSYFVMLTFTIYLIVLVTFAANVPCACGGILGQMGYTVHIIFNILFTGIALFGSLKTELR